MFEPSQRLKAFNNCYDYSKYSVFRIPYSVFKLLLLFLRCFIKTDRIHNEGDIPLILSSTPPLMKRLYTPLLLLSFQLPYAVAQTVTTAADSTKTNPSAQSTTAPSDSLSIDLNEAKVTATKLMFVTKKDTVVYNLDALAATKGDMLGDLINKMPGLEMRKDGLYFKGKKVNRLLVNGTDFVRGNTQSALENLPAYIIKSLKAYEGQTDRAKITGIDDGTKEVVVDAILKKEYLGTWTGNAALGYGTDDRWRARLFANTFSDRYRVTAFGGFTNTGEFQATDNNGTWNDVGAGSSSGDTKFMRPGTSWMWNNGRKADEGGYFKLEGGINWDYRGHKDYFYQEQEKFLGDGTSRFTATDQRSKNDEKIINTNLYFTWKPSKHTHIEFGPSYSFIKQTDHSHERSGNWTVPAFEMVPSVLDSLDLYPETGWPGNRETLYAHQEQSSSNENRHYYAHNLWITQRLTKKNLRFSLRHQLSYHQNREDMHDLMRYRYYNQTEHTMDPLYNRFGRNKGENFNQITFADLNIPIPQLQSLRLTYGYSNTKNSKDDKGHRLEKLGGIFADYDAYLQHFGILPDLADWELQTVDPDMTLYSTTTDHRHWAEAELSYNKKGLIAYLKGLGKFGRDAIDYERPTYEPLHPRRNVKEWAIDARLRYESDSLGNIELSYSYTKEPQSFYSAITIPDRSDPLNVFLGNPDMKDTRRHIVNFIYSRTLKNNRWYSMNTSWHNTLHQQTSRQTYDKVTGVTTSQPVTLCGNWGINAIVSMGMPLDKKQRFNLMSYISYSMSHNPAFTLATDGHPQRRSDTSHNTGLYARLNYRYEKFFASINGSVWYIAYRSDLAASQDRWMGNYGGTLQYTLPLDIELKTNVNVYHRNVYQSQGVRPVKAIWNAMLTRSFLRDKSLALQLEASDILNHRDQSNAYMNIDGREAFYGQCVSRYFMFHVIYNFSTKKK